MHNEQAYYIEQLSYERLKDLALLHHAVYQRRPDPGFFEKKYATAYTGKQYIGFIAYNFDGEPVGYYGVIPCFLRYNGEPMMAAQSADTMTHPGYRFKGLFVQLADLCYARCRQEGIHLIFGFPNQNSYHGAVNKLGWQIAGQMNCFSIPVAAIPLAKLAGKTVITKSLYRRYATVVLGKHYGGMMPDTPRNENFDGVLRNQDHLQYKTYYQHHVLQLNHAVCWIKLQEALVIGDMELRGDKNFDRAISEIKRVARRLGFRQIQYHVSEGTAMHDLFAGRYNAVPSFPVLFRDLGFAQPLDRFKFSFADIDIF